MMESKRDLTNYIDICYEQMDELHRKISILTVSTSLFSDFPEVSYHTNN